MGWQYCVVNLLMYCWCCGEYVGVYVVGWYYDVGVW